MLMLLMSGPKDAMNYIRHYQGLGGAWLNAPLPSDGGVSAKL
jgi:hypothetical protein